VSDEDGGVAALLLLWASFRRRRGGAFDVVVFVVFWCENWVCQLLVEIIVAGITLTKRICCLP
jgi:hypothetical protein